MTQEPTGVPAETVAGADDGGGDPEGGAATPKYQMTLSLNVLNHLGLNLYSNLPAVLSEAVANAWDADATEVSITIDSTAKTMTISDNGIGMTIEDVNDKYLRVGFRRREDDPAYGRKTRRGRDVMGRKGIGKLSLFSIAKTIEVRSMAVRPDPFDPATGQEHHAGLVMDVDVIKEQIGQSAKGGTYYPQPLPDDDRRVERGTTITLKRPKKDLKRTAAFLRRRLARRFATLPDDFTILLDGKAVTDLDREISPKVRYAWIFGDGDYVEKIKGSFASASSIKTIGGVTEGGRTVNGWIGSAFESGDLKPAAPGDETSNNITVLVRGKLAQEDVLDLAEQGGLFTKFITGELNADFLDDSDLDDIATSSRQGIDEDDDRFLDLKDFLQSRMRKIGTDWNNLREADGLKDALVEVPAINDWIKKFSGDSRKAAESFIGKIRATAVDPASRTELLMSGVIAFERMYHAQRLSAIETVDETNIPALLAAFRSIDDVESAIYYDLVRGRLDVIDKFEQLVAEDNREVVLQEYIFDHLWLLDPGWDKATKPIMEQTVAKLIEKPGTPKDRFDIKYRITGTNHVIVELKKSDRKVSTAALIEQINKYRYPILSHLQDTEGSTVEVQTVCLVGKDLTDWKNPGGREASRQQLLTVNARVVKYDKLMKDAKQAYQEYLDEHRELGPVREVLAQIESALQASTNGGPVVADGS